MKFLLAVFKDLGCQKEPIGSVPDTVQGREIGKYWRWTTTLLVWSFGEFADSMVNIE